MDKEPGGTRDEASRDNQDVKERQSFPMGSVDSMVGESSQSRESRTLAPVQEIRSRGIQLFHEQPIVRQPQPGQHISGWDPSTQSVIIITSQSSIVRRHNIPELCQ